MASFVAENARDAVSPHCLREVLRPSNEARNCRGQSVSDS